jgi:hypothetical protein
VAAVLERVQQAQEGRGNVSAAIFGVPTAQLRAPDEERGGRCRDRTCDPIHVKGAVCASKALTFMAIPLWLL